MKEVEKLKKNREERRYLSLYMCIVEPTQLVFVGKHIMEESQFRLLICMLKMKV